MASLLLLYIAYEYFYKDLRLQELVEQSRSILSAKSGIYLGIVILLMPINWLLEAMKWREGLGSRVQIGRREAFWAVFQGVSLGIVTPGRVGEYGGRVVHLDSEDRVKGVVSTLVCSMYQNMINVMVGSIGIFILAERYLKEVSNSRILGLTGIGISVGIVIVLMRLEWIMGMLSKRRIFKKRIAYLSEAGGQLGEINKFNLLTYATLRYLVYVFQYFLIFQIFVISFGAFETLCGISIIYAIQTLLPLTPLLQVGLRGSIAIAVFSPISSEENAIILASYCLWLINLLIPSVIGGFLLLFRKKEADSVQKKLL